jgi:hypothetical protein
MMCSNISFLFKNTTLRQLNLLPSLGQIWELRNLLCWVLWFKQVSIAGMGVKFWLFQSVKTCSAAHTTYRAMGTANRTVMPFTVMQSAEYAGTRHAVCNPWCIIMVACLTHQSLFFTVYTTGFNIHKFYVLPTQCIYVFCVDLRINSDYFPIQHQLFGFYNGDGVCLLRGTDLGFKYNSS